MDQCKARTVGGTRCKLNVAAPSPSLCKRHQATVARGTVVVNIETGRKFPQPKR